MKILEIRKNKKQYMELLILADEQEDMIDKYIKRGTMFILDDNGDGTYTLIGDVKQIGKMPGSIHVKLSISVNNGVISPTTNEESAGELKILKTFPVALI